MQRKWNGAQILTLPTDYIADESIVLPFICIFKKSPNTVMQKLRNLHAQVKWEFASPSRTTTEDCNIPLLRVLPGNIDCPC